LGVNYRSDERIVDVFTEFARHASIRRCFAAEPAGRPRLERRTGRASRCGSADDEISALAASITALHARHSHGGQAVLCASNARLNAIAEGLEARGIPALHLGSLFERPEIRISWPCCRW
jgi:superfamily I DNA/RNA helicase